MLNVYDFMKELPASKRLMVNDLLFADYKCPLSESRFDMWTHHNYFVYVIKGKKKWFSRDSEVLAQAGDCIFVKKGAHSIYQYFDDDFCSLFIFVPDEFIRDTLLENQVKIHNEGDYDEPAPIVWVQINEMLASYFYSFLTYISKTGTYRDITSNQKQTWSSGDFNEVFSRYNLATDGTAIIENTCLQTIITIK